MQLNVRKALDHRLYNVVDVRLAEAALCLTFNTLELIIKQGFGNFEVCFLFT